MSETTRRRTAGGGQLAPRLTGLAARLSSSPPAALTVTLLVVTVPFWELLVGTRTGMWGDTPAAYVPRYVATWENIRGGTSPNWWGAMFGGLNTLGTGQSATYYLPNALFGWMEALGAYRIWFFLHLWAMAAGWFLWGRRRWGTPLAGFLTGVGGSLNGYLIYHSIFMPFTSALALLPWALLALDLLLEHGRWRYVGAFALVLGGISLCGLPQLLWILLIALGVIAVVQLCRRTTPLLRWIQVVAGFTLGLGIGAIQLLPLLRQSNSSRRARLGTLEAFEYSAAPRHLLTLLLPGVLGGGNGVPGSETPWLGSDLQHEVANYLGVTFVVLAILGAIAQRRTRVVVAPMVLAVLGLLTALGGHTFVGDFVYHVVPFANRFRAWARNELWLNMAVVMLVGAGPAQFVRQPRRVGTRLFAAAAVGAIIVTLLPALSPLNESLVPGSGGAATRLIPIVLVAAVAGTTLLLLRNRRLGLCLLAVICALDLGLFAVTGPWRRQGLPVDTAQQVFSANAPVFGPVADSPGGLDRWVSDVPDAGAFWLTALGNPGRSVTGYDPLVNADYATTVGDMAYNGYIPTPILWSGGWLPDILRTTTLIASPYAGTPASSWTAYGTFGDSILYSYTPRLAESYLVGFAQPGTLDDARNGINNPDTPLTEFAYVDTGTIDDTAPFAALTAPGPSGTVNSGAMDDGGHGRWSVTADRPSLFVTSYAWMDGWTATVDGKPVPVARTNALVLGVPVPAGTHEVRLAFTPPGWTAGRNISITALAVVVLLLASSTPLGRRVLDAGRQRLRRTPTTTTS